MKENKIIFMKRVKELIQHEKNITCLSQIGYDTYFDTLKKLSTSRTQNDHRAVSLSLSKTLAWHYCKNNP